MLLSTANYAFTPVCDCVHGGGGCIPACITDHMTNQYYIGSCVDVCSQCCDSIQVTSNALWHRSHGTPPGRHPSLPLMKTGHNALTHPTGMHSCYRPQRSCGQGNVFTGVCLSTGGGVCLSACWDAIPPLDGEPPLMENPPLDGEPPPGSRLQHTVYERPVRILLECILVIYCSCGNCRGVTAAMYIRK